MSEDESIPVGSGEPETAAVAKDAAVDAVDAAAARAETVEVGEDGNEETPVIDVHAPHGGVHTWKDFWIHLGTITLGLLIAIGLEQSVEAMHRLHQRHQLEADLQAEGVENQALAEKDLRSMDDRMATTAALLREVESTLAGRRKMDAPFPASSFTPPPLTGGNFFALPLSAVWTTAKESVDRPASTRDCPELYTPVHTD